MLCCISSKIPQEPVVSKINGALFERRLIEKYIDEHQKCPLSGEPLSRSDLISISSGKAPTPGVVGSIPSLLSSLQSEWDAVMLEQFSLRQQLSQAHQELSQALYQHEASCRVIAKLIRERDVLASKLKEKDPSAEIPEPLDERSDVLPKEIVDEMEYNMKALKEQRNRKGHNPNVAPAAMVSGFREKKVFVSNNAGSTPSAILSGAVAETQGHRTLFTGGYDGRITSYDLDQGVVRASMIGHTKPVRCVQIGDDLILSGSDDSTIRLWKESSTGYQGLRVMKVHRGPVVGFAVLPSRRHILSAGADGKVSFTDFERGFTLATGESEDATTGFSCIGLQPDGMLAVTGSAGRLLIWDVRQMSVVLAKGDGSNGSITSVCFNEDGYTMAASTGGGSVDIFDFRNIDKPVVSLSSNATGLRQASNKVSFNKDGGYLAIASQVVSLWDWKSQKELISLSCHTEPVTDVAWGADARWLVSTSLDKTVRLYE